MNPWSRILPMASGNAAVFASLKTVFSNVAPHLAVKTDESSEYSLVTKAPSPFPQHKGHPLVFGWVKVSKAYTSLHLMTLTPQAVSMLSPALKKRMQGKTCFNFTSDPEPELIAELKKLAEAGMKQWAGKKWI